jgi:DNA polymerase III delta prime subunit
MPFGRWKIVLLDEADYLTPAGQAMLRNDIEAYSSTVRFILTCNYAHRIIPALKSRCHEIHITKTDRVEFTARAATVLVTENIEFDIDTLDGYVDATYPDLRKCLNQLQVNSASGVLLPLQQHISDENAELIEAAELFKAGKFNEGRQQVLQLLSLKPTALEEIYKWMYGHLDLWGRTHEQKDAVIVVLRNSVANLGTAAIPEIHLAATFAEISLI